MSESLKKIIEVAIPLRLNKSFHYTLPESMHDSEFLGRRVLVPFGKYKLTGYAVAAVETSAFDKLKDIIEILDSEPLWKEHELEFFRWVSAYYLYPLADVLKTALPGGINIRSVKNAGSGVEKMLGGKKVRFENIYKATEFERDSLRLGKKAAIVLDVICSFPEISSGELNRRFGSSPTQLKRLLELGLITVQKRELFRDPFRNLIVVPDTPRKLNHHQQNAVKIISTALKNGAFSPFLLHGVTGSGKTEVYLQAIAVALEYGKNALVLTPEISLTPQLVKRFRARFDNAIAILHSGLSDGERYDEWRRIRRGQVRIVIGARSAIFAPLENIGVIVVDEEHEASFKQSDGLRYNARDLALVRGRMEQAVVLLGTATPLITTLYSAECGKLTLLSIPERVESRPMPVVKLAIVKSAAMPISTPLLESIEKTLEKRQQAIIFLNRRGFATYLVCADCGTALSCPNCSVSLTYHRQRSHSVCHYCDYFVPAPGVCSKCGGELQEFGAGTEKVEEELKALFPEARILRMDSDTTSGKGSHERLLSRMAENGADILIGTQMISKGHDFPNVTLVGVINAEASLAMPDFKAAERTFQILSQVMGRAGRGDTPGEVILQSTGSDHYAIQTAINNDGADFYRQELEFRKEAGYPPFSHLACIGFSGTAEKAVEAHSIATAALLLKIKTEQRLRVEILGAIPAPLYKLRGRFRRQILLKSALRSDLRQLLALWQAEHNFKSTQGFSKNVRETVDIDPVDML